MGLLCNPGAEELLKAESVLQLAKEQLRLADSDLNLRLQSLLRRCLRSADDRTFGSLGKVLEIPRPNRADLQLWIKPVHPDVSLLLGKPAGYVAVYVYDPEAGVPIDPDRLSQLYGLSKAETRVAMALLANPDPAEVAKCCFISPHTVRSHLKAIFAKTGAQGQADLMKRLLSGPARRR